MILSLHVGFVVFSALQVADSDVVKALFRIVSLSLGGLILLIFKKDIQVLLIAFFACFLIYNLNENVLIFNFIFIVFFVSVVSCFDVEDFAAIIFLVSILGCLIHVACYHLGYVSPEVTDFGGRIRLTLGFSNSNTLALSYYSLICSGAFFLYFKRNMWAVFLLFFSVLVAVPIIFVSDSRTFLFAIGLFFLLSILVKGKVILPFVRIFVSILPFLCMVISIGLGWFSSDDLNVVLSYRPSFFYNYLVRIDELSVWWGWFTSAEDTIDNAYLLLLGALGFPITFFLLFFLGFRIYNLDRDFLPFIATMLIISVFESVLFRPEIPVTLIFFILIFSRNNKFLLGKVRR